MLSGRELFNDPADLQAVMALTVGELEHIIQSVTDPKHQLAAFFRISMSPWNDGVRGSGLLKEKDAKSADELVLWLIVSALIALADGKGVYVGVLQARLLGGTSASDGQRKIRLAEEMGLIEMIHPKVGKTENRKVKLCVPTKKALALYEKQIKFFRRGFGKSLESFSKSTVPSRHHMPPIDLDRHLLR